MKISKIEVTPIFPFMGTDLDVVNAARVSFAKESDFLYFRNKSPVSKEWYGGEGCHKELKKEDEKLITYLAKHGHWSPFSHVYAKFRIKVPIFLARQLHKHIVALPITSPMAQNEVSRRYVDDEPEFFFPNDWRKRAENVKQGSSNEKIESITDCYNRTYCISETAKFITTECLNLYIDMIKQGVSPEQARMILPQNMMTEWIWSGSLMAFSRVCKLRLEEHAQKENLEVAQPISNILSEHFPVSWKALMEN